MQEPDEGLIAKQMYLLPPLKAVVAFELNVTAATANIKGTGRFGSRSKVWTSFVLPTFGAGFEHYLPVPVREAL
jgi:hypothetical protein